MIFGNRFELFVRQNARLLVVGFAITGLLFLVASGYIFLNPTTATVTEETNEQQFSSQAGTSAVVTGNTTLYEPDAQLVDKSIYFISATPEVTIWQNLSVPADQQVDVSQELRKEVVGLRNGEPFYRSEETLLETTHTTTNGSMNAAGSIHVGDLREDLQQKRAEVQGEGEFEVRLHMTTSYQASEYEGTLESTAPMVISGQAYYIDGSLDDSQTRSTLVQREVQDPANPVEYGGLAVGGLFLFGLCLVVRRIEETADPERLRTNIVHSRHTEWISRGEFPTSSDKQYINILSLTDLVDVAIDTNRRVIYDPDLNAYAVIDSQEIYYYSVGGESTDQWLDI